MNYFTKTMRNNGIDYGEIQSKAVEEMHEFEKLHGRYSNLADNDYRMISCAIAAAIEEKDRQAAANTAKGAAPQ